MPIIAMALPGARLPNVGNRFVFIPRTTSTAIATTRDYKLAAGFQPDIKAKKTLTDVLSNAAHRNYENRVPALYIRNLFVYAY